MTDPIAKKILTLTSITSGNLSPIKEEIPDFQSIDELIHILTTRGCKRCSLGYQEGINGCVIGRGNPKSKRILLGEAPGRDENISGKAFTGAAGRLLDRIFASINMNTDEDWWITNCNLCRPIAPEGSGRENFTPKEEQYKQCFPFWCAQQKIIQPKIIVLLGKTAVSNLFPELKKFSMKKLGGWHKKIDDVWYFVIHHPAALLHAKKRGLDYEQELKEKVWEDVQALKNLIEKEDL